MWRGEQDWLHYIKNIIAADLPSAVFLASYLRQVGNNNNYFETLEVIDINKGKIISNPTKVQSILHKHANKPFLFVVGKN